MAKPTANPAKNTTKKTPAVEVKKKKAVSVSIAKPVKKEATKAVVKPEVKKSVKPVEVKKSAPKAKVVYREIDLSKAIPDPRLETKTFIVSMLEPMAVLDYRVRQYNDQTGNVKPFPVEDYLLTLCRDMFKTEDMNASTRIMTGHVTDTTRYLTDMGMDLNAAIITDTMVFSKVVDVLSQAIPNIRFNDKVTFTFNRPDMLVDIPL